MIRNRLKEGVVVLFGMIALLSTTLFGGYPNLTAPTILETIQSKGKIDVIILNAPTVYYVGANETKGFEYDLIYAYAQSIGVDLNLTVVHTVKEALELTRQGVGDITVASLAVNEERAKEFKFGPLYHTITEQLICHNSLYKEKKMPQHIDDLKGLKVMVGEDTAYESTLSSLQADDVSIVGDSFRFRASRESSTEQLLKKVWEKDLDCTVADSHVFMINQRYYPELVKVMDLSQRKHLGWIVREGDDSLVDSLYRWLNRFERSGKLKELNGFYFDFLKLFDYYDTKVFYRRIQTRLPKYEKYFKAAGKKYDIPWIILAAQAYQESHWNPNATSPTGVRGLMMLTNATAKLMKVKNRLNVQESIEGGAKYFAMIRKKFPKEVKGKHLWAFTLAAYNVGLGHIHDAQGLAKKLNKNPYSWQDLKSVLPLLAQKKYYRNLKYGYARGNEPVRYVDAIQHYYSIILKKRIPKKRIEEIIEKSVIVDTNESADSNSSYECY